MVLIILAIICFILGIIWAVLSVVQYKENGTVKLVYWTISILSFGQSIFLYSSSQ